MVLMYPGNREADKQYYIDQLKKLGMEEILLVGDEAMDHTLEELRDMSQDSITDFHGEQEPFLFFVQEDPRKVALLQKALHEDGRDIDRMAMQTENNMPWTFRKLYDDVSAEAHWFETREKLADLIRQADVQRLQSEPKYQQAVYSCYTLLQSDQEIPQRLLDMAVEMLEAANQNI